MRKEEGCAKAQQPRLVKTKPAEINTEEHRTGEKVYATRNTGSMTDDSQSRQDTDIQTTDVYGQPF